MSSDSNALGERVACTRREPLGGRVAPLTPMARLSGSTGQASQMTVGQEIVITRCLSSAANVAHTLPHDSFTPSIFTVGMCTGYKFSPLRGLCRCSPQYSVSTSYAVSKALFSFLSCSLSLSVCMCVCAAALFSEVHCCPALQQGARCPEQRSGSNSSSKEGEGRGGER